MAIVTSKTSSVYWLPDPIKLPAELPKTPCCRNFINKVKDWENEGKLYDSGYGMPPCYRLLLGYWPE